MEMVREQDPKKEPDNREIEPQLIGDHLVNIYSKALQPRHTTVCTVCVLRLKKAFEPFSIKYKDGKERTFKAIDRLRIFWHTYQAQRILRSGTCRRCGKVYTE